MNLLQKTSFENLNVIIIGDVMIDRYFKGKVERISPEAPVPIHMLQDIDNRLGGAANVALNIKSLGATPYLMSVVGNDTEGNVLRSILENHQIDISNIITEKQRKTTTKTRIVAGTQQLIRIDYEDTNDINSTTQKKLIQSFEWLIANKKINAVIFQDYNKGVLTKKLIQTMINISNENDIITCVDPKKKNFWEYKNVTLFKPNLKEISDAFRTKINVELEDLEELHIELQKKLNHITTFITLSDKGIYANQNNKSILVPTKTKNIIDVSGAGDSVISIATLCYIKNMDIEDICKLSNIAGGKVCEQAGVVPIFIEDLINIVK